MFITNYYPTLFIERCKNKPIYVGYCFQPNYMNIILFNLVTWIVTLLYEYYKYILYS